MDERPTPRQDRSRQQRERDEVSALLRLVGTLGLTVGGGIALCFFSAWSPIAA